MGGEGNENELTRAEALRVLAAVEKRSSHPISIALLEAAAKEGVVEYADDAVADFKVVKGQGCEATVDGHLVAVGNMRMLYRVIKPTVQMQANPEVEISETELNTFLDSIHSSVRATALAWEQEQGATVCWLLFDGKPVAVLSASDVIREEAAEAVERMGALSPPVHTVMLTGDNKGVATAVAGQVHVDTFHAGLLPQDKVDHLKQLRAMEGLPGSKKANDKNKGGIVNVVGMVGDGINDTPALALANVGIAMGITGTPAAVDTADVALMDTDLRKLVKVIEIGRECLTKIRQNIIFCMVMKLATVIISLAGYAHLWLAIVADVGAMLVVTLNSSSILGVPSLRQKSMRESNASKGSLNAKEIDQLAEVSANGSGCSKGCCSYDAPSVAVATTEDGCSKGCCSSDAPSVSVATTEDGCSKGCCSSDAPSVSVATTEDGCSKGCCSSEASSGLDAEDTMKIDNVDSESECLW